MGDHKLLRLHKHAAGTAAGVKDAPFVRLQHLHQQLHHALGRVELAALLAFGQGKLAQEILKDVAQHVGAALLRLAQGDVADQVDQAAQVGGVEVAASKHLRQHAAQAGVVALDGVHRRIHFLADFGVFSLGLQVAPAGRGGHEEDVFGAVFVAVFGVAPLVGREFGVQGLEGAGDVAQEDEAEDDVFVFGGVDVFAEFVGRFPELFFEWFSGVIVGHADQSFPKSRYPKGQASLNGGLSG